MCIRITTAILLAVAVLGMQFAVGQPAAAQEAYSIVQCDSALSACDSLYGDEKRGHGGRCLPEGFAHCSEGCFEFKLTDFNIYPTFSYRGPFSATYTEFEYGSLAKFGGWEMENRTVLNVADLPSNISLGPTNPGDPPNPAGRRAQGFGDILSGFFFSGRGASEHDTHLGIGPVITFPSATDDILGSRQWTIGPGAHFSTKIGRLDAGFFIWQSWRFAGSTTSKRVNQLFGKPFFIYEMSEKWNLVSIPLGLSHSWEAKSGDDWTVPLGGGIRRLFTVHGQDMGLQFQAFDYVARKPLDPEWELRFTIEFLYD